MGMSLLITAPYRVDHPRELDWEVIKDWHYDH